MSDPGPADQAGCALRQRRRGLLRLDRVRRSCGGRPWPCRTPRSTMASSVISGPSSSATSRPARMTSTRWASPRISSTSFEMSRIAIPSAGEADQDLVDVALGADVDAAGRLVGEEDSTVRSRSSARRAASAGCRPTATPPAPRGWGEPSTRSRASRTRASLGPASDEAQPLASRRRLVRLTFSRTGRRRISPSSLRDSGIIATPAWIDAAGRPGEHGVATCDAHRRSCGLAPKIARASSDRPAPTSPASPTISPARSVSVAPWTPGADRPSDGQGDGCVRRRQPLVGVGAADGPAEHRR